ncbi:MAG: cyclic nucleotide-binding domain-containing protein [Chloroflexi bacterium]|nr:cyclic nucleotide-binding domain-containing protein [Chloroflexota bacterium]
MAGYEELLRNVPLLRGFSDGELRHLAGLVVERRFAADRVVFRQGDPADSLYLIVSGRLRVQMVTHGHQEVTLAMLGPGDVFGEMALLGNQPRSATVATVTDAMLLAVSKEVFERYLVANPSAVREMLRIVSHRQQDNVLRLSSLVEAPPPETQARAKIIALASTKGGVGRTTLAASLAVAFRLAGANRVALVDCCLQFGDIALLCNVQPKETVVDLVPYVRELTPEVVLAASVSHFSGIRVFAAPPRPELADLVQGEHIQAILAAMASEFDIIVVDTPPILQDVTLAIFDAAHLIVVVTAPEIASLKDAQILLATLQSIGHRSSKMAIAVNRFDSVGAIRPDDLSHFLGRAIDFRLPNDWRNITDARNHGVPPIIAAPKSPWSIRVLEMAQSILSHPSLDDRQ